MSADLSPVWACWPDILPGDRRAHHVFLATKRPHFVRSSSRWPAGKGQVMDRVAEWDADDRDVYFTINVFGRNDASANAAITRHVLFADLDDKHGFDRDRLKRLRPTFWWNTSPRSVHALWLMPTPAPEGINVYGRGGISERLTDWLHADPNGWHAGKFGRVPGTTNTKPDYGGSWRSRKGVRVGEQCSWESLYAVLGDPDTFTRPRTPKRAQHTPEVAQGSSRARQSAMRAAMRGNITGHEDRSGLQNKRVCSLFEAGLTVDEVLLFVLTPGCPLYDDGKRDPREDVPRIWERWIARRQRGVRA